MKIALFIIGFLLGGFSGIGTMCLIQISRISEEKLMKGVTEHEKTEHQKADLGE